MTNAVDVSYRNRAYRAQEFDWQICRDVFEGTAAIRRNRALYVPQNKGEAHDKYERRVNRTRFYNLLEPTVKGLAGMIFRKPPTLDESAGPITVRQSKNVDGEGTHLVVFARELCEAALLLGHAGILVDAPPAPNLNGRAPTKADQAAIGRLPVWVLVRADQIINARKAVDAAGQSYLTLLVIEEEQAEPDGAFGEACLRQWRVFRCDSSAVTWELWQATDAAPTAEKAQIDGGTIPGATRIRFSPFYAGHRKGLLHTKPELLALAETNLDLFATQVDYAYNLHVTNTPIAVFKGRDPKTREQRVGAETGVDLPADPNANAFYLESSGAGLEASRQAQLDQIQRATIYGLQMLAPETRGVEAAQSKIIDQSEKTSRLAVVARRMQDCLEQALVFSAEMTGEPVAGITVNLDITGLTLDAPTLAAYSAMVTQRQLTPRTLWSWMQERGGLPEDFDPDQEEAALDALSAFDDASSTEQPPNAIADPNAAHPGDTETEPMKKAP